MASLTLASIFSCNIICEIHNFILAMESVGIFHVLPIVCLVAARTWIFSSNWILNRSEGFAQRRAYSVLRGISCPTSVVKMEKTADQWATIYEKRIPTVHILGNRRITRHKFSNSNRWLWVFVSNWKHSYWSTIGVCLCKCKKCWCMRNMYCVHQAVWRSEKICRVANSCPYY